MNSQYYDQYCHLYTERSELLFPNIIINIAPSEISWMLHTSDYGVVEEDKDDEGGVEEGERDEELVERVAHLSSWPIIPIHLRCKSVFLQQVRYSLDQTLQKHCPGPLAKWPKTEYKHVNPFILCPI